jgi:hypothetical protein
MRFNVIPQPALADLAGAMEFVWQSLAEKGVNHLKVHFSVDSRIGLGLQGSHATSTPARIFRGQGGERIGPGECGASAGI